MALRRKAGDNVEGGSLGGARSPRPSGKAELAPRRSVSITCVNEGTRPNGDMSLASGGLPCGRAEPAPPRGGPSKLGWPCGEKPGIMWGVVLSEGRGPRARTVRRDEWQGIALPPVPFREAGGQEGAMLGLASCHPCGRAEPAPPRGASVGERPFGQNPGIMRRVVLSEGRGLRARMARPN